MKSQLYVVLMAGGAGVRFWPYSRNAKPKQFLDALGLGKSLLQLTYQRFLPICDPDHIYVVTHEEHAGLVKEQLPDLADAQILAEPMRKNTAACIAYASFEILQKNPEAVIVVSPSDHLILREAEFLDIISRAANLASSQDKLFTLGIYPTRPETGYGYIQYLHDDSFAKRVKTFTEKPHLELARTFLESGDFVWNSGIFIWGVQAIMASLRAYMPEYAEIFDELYSRSGGKPTHDEIVSVYAQCKNVSIDYGIMEKASNVYMCMGEFAWSDLGSWGSIHDISDKDENHNVIDANALVYDSTNCIIKGSKDKLIVVQGLHEYLIGEFGNVVIVCDKNREDQFRRFVNDVKARPGGGEFL
jgi:mannose-1-phosphate guanylyltransferase